MPYDSGNECWKMRLIGLDGKSRGLLKLAQKSYDADGRETWEIYCEHRWAGKPGPKHFEFLYQWDLHNCGYLYFILLQFGHEFTDDDYLREVTPETAIEWLRNEGYELSSELKDLDAGTDADATAEASGGSPLAPLSSAQQQVWNALANCVLGAKEIAGRVDGGLSNAGAVRKLVAAIRRTGRVIEFRRGVGYFRPDAPPPEETGAQRESIVSPDELTMKGRT